MNCPTDLLIDIGSSDQGDQDSDKNQETKSASRNCQTEDTDTASSGKVETAITLSGFLTKISTSGIIKTTKSRWFSFHPETCELFYYRTNNMDGMNNPPLGKISLRRASFNFSAMDIQENIFTITADGVTHNMQACDKETLLWWLQELQAQRRVFNVNQTDKVIEDDEWSGCLLGQSIFWVPNSSNSKTGLLNVIKKKNNSPVTESDMGVKLLPQPDPFDSVGGISVNKSRTSSMRSSSLSSFGSRLLKLGGISSTLATAGSPIEDVNTSRLIHQLKENNDLVHQEMDLLKSKLQSKEEAVQLLKLELEKYEQIKEQERSFSKDDYKLRSELIGLKLDKERLEQEKGEGLAREGQLKERVSMLEEMLAVKDEVVIQLSNQVYDLETKQKVLSSDFDKMRVEKNEEFVILTPTDADESFTDLKDRLEGYMMQNNLLNHEILELAKLRHVDAQKIQSLHDKAQQCEAEYCQLYSKYLVLLSEMNKPSSDSIGLAVAGSKADSSDEDRKEMLKILIQDALKDADASPSEQSETNYRRRKYDQYGFNNLPDDDTESTLLATASQLEKQSSDILQSLRKYNDSVAIKWQNYLTINKELQRDDEVKALIRLGVPHELRAQLWSWIVGMRTITVRQKLEVGQSYYKHLVSSRDGQLPSKQIELDLLRTLPNNKHFCSMSSSGIEQLRRVLHAYSIHNPRIGYCQGLNRVAAVALLYLCEEEAFWCLVAIVECIMPADYYSTTLTASQADQRVFRELMSEKLPRLHKHLETAGVDSSLITFNWMLCIYCDNVPPETMLHIWDCLLYEGSKVLFRFGLAFFKHVEDEILQLSDYMAIFNFMRIMSHRMHDVRELNQLAFYGMNPFPMRRITRLRQVHLEKVSAELKELDELRKGFVSMRRDPNREFESDED